MLITFYFRRQYPIQIPFLNLSTPQLSTTWASVSTLISSLRNRTFTSPYFSLESEKSLDCDFPWDPTSTLSHDCQNMNHSLIFCVKLATWLVTPMVVSSFLTVSFLWNFYMSDESAQSYHFFCYFEPHNSWQKKGPVMKLLGWMKWGPICIIQVLSMTTKVWLYSYSERAASGPL